MQGIQIELQGIEQRELFRLIDDDSLHCRWLNTLSLLENIGARKISASQRFLVADENILQHCFEEHRHAWYLKKQIKKLDSKACPTYESRYLLAPVASKHYLNKLDVAVCRLIKQATNADRRALVKASYLWVTYAIEVRAAALYENYQSCLEQAGSPVSVRSIIFEEENHLEQMKDELSRWSADWLDWANEIEKIEEALYGRWRKAISEHAFRGGKLLKVAS